MKKLVSDNIYVKPCLVVIFCLVSIGLLIWAAPQDFRVIAQSNDFQQKEVDIQESDEILIINSQNSDQVRSSEEKRKVNSFQVKEKFSPAASYTNSTPITITDCPNPCPASGQPASLYPSPINVTGEVGVVQRVSVTLNGFSHAFPADVDVLLVSPSGRKSVIMSDVGAGSPGVSNINVSIDDYANTPITTTVTGNTGISFVSGIYRPNNSGTTDLFPSPAPSGPYTYTLSAFNGDNPNGTWNLYVIDDANLDGGSISGGWTITFDVRPPAPAAGDILISEFRTRGVGTTPPGSDGSADEYIELYNNTDSSITIIDAVPGADPTSGAGAGWRLSVAQGAAETEFFVLSQTQSTSGPVAIPARGHFLIATQPSVPNPAGNTYSLSTYPTGTGFTASGSPNITINPSSATVGFLPDNAGIAIFSTVGAVTANRLDSVGFSSVTNTDYKEGTGLSPATGITTASQHAWVRKMNAGVPQDTSSNSDDFHLIETTGAILDGVQSILGAPGPERAPTSTAFTTTGSPIHNQTTTNMTVAPIDPLVPVNQAPNTVYDPTPVTNGGNGTLKIRRTITNNSGATILALRYRIVTLNTIGNMPTGFADLRSLNSPTQTISTSGGNVNTDALTVQTPPAQTLGGGINTSLSQGIITTTAPLANGASRSVEFNLGVQTFGFYNFAVIIEGAQVDQRGTSSIISSSGCVGPSASPGDPCFAPPTAATVSVGGRVVRSNGRAASQVRIIMTDSTGVERYTSTNIFGYFRFNNVPVGETYIFSAHGKGYQPVTFVRTVMEELTDLNIILQE